MNRMRYEGPGLNTLKRNEWQPFNTDGTSMKLPPGVDISSVNSVTGCVVQIAIKLRKIYDSL